MRKLDLYFLEPPHELQLLVAYGCDEQYPLGELECLRGTPWERGVFVVSGTCLSHALHGMPSYLLKELPVDTHAMLKKITGDASLCGMSKTCPQYKPDLCRPGGQLKKERGPPACYEPPLDDRTPPMVLEIFRAVAQAWSEGRVVVAVKGEEFSLK